MTRLPDDFVTHLAEHYSARYEIDFDSVFDNDRFFRLIEKLESLTRDDRQERRETLYDIGYLSFEQYMISEENDS